MGKIKKVYLVSHTHWDREWYLTRESFRLMLVELIDRLLEILDNDENYNAFMLDGQTIILEDYLEIRPENEAKLKEYVKKGRILIGPWYILPDELLISGEAHIRNYLLGDEICKRFGGKANLGYLPDSFGHPSQMPQIIKGLGMNELIFWRGVGPEIQNTDFIWEGPDGSQIIAVNMPFGYGTAACLPNDREHFVWRIKHEVERLEKVTNGDAVLLMNGVDHIAPEPYLTKMLCETKEDFDYEIIHTTLDKYVNYIKESEMKLEHYKGELRSPMKAYLLGGTLSTRMYLKQQNFFTEQLIEKKVEPIATIAYCMGFNYPKGEINKLWKYALSNLPHDSICGCSIDDVHKEMMTRYGFIEQLGQGLLERLLSCISSRITSKHKNYGSFLVFNTLAYKRNDIVHISIDIEPRLIRKVNYDNYQKLEEFEIGERKMIPKGIKIYDSEGNKVACSLKYVERAVKMKLSLDNQPEMYEVLRLNVLMLAKDVPALGYKQYYYDVDYENNSINKDMELNIENEYFIVTASSEDGSLEIYDKITGKKYKNCCKFVDYGDAGDEYSYSPPLIDFAVYPLKESIKIELSEKNEVVQTLKVKGVLRLPISVSNDRKERQKETIDCPFENIISLYSGIRRIDVKTNFENKAKDHVLKVVFPTGIDSKYSYAESVFSVDCRSAKDINDNSDYSSWVEEPSGTNPQKTFVDVNNGEVGLAIANQGIPEFNVQYDGKEAVISLTLLRCIGWLSRKDLLYRKGNGGWTLETPDAQCIGNYNFNYSIIPHSGDWISGEVLRKSYEFATPLFTFQIEDKGVDENSEFSLFEIDNSNIVLSCLKLAENGDGIVARFVNQSDMDVDMKLKINIPASDVYDVYYVRLDEKIICPAEYKNGIINILFKPWEIVTILFKIK